MIISGQAELLFTIELYTKLEFRNYCRPGFRAYVPVGYPHRFGRGNDATPVDQHVPSAFAKQRYPHSGLTIARAFIEAQGGGIWVVSAGVGQGSTFVFTLPSAK